MAPKASQSAGALPEVWFTSDDWLLPEPRRRSYPRESTRLEILATRLGIDDEELREILRAEVHRRQRERGEAWGRLDHTLEKRESA